MTDMIGPLTAAEWALFRLRHDDRGALPACCATVSEFRAEVFDLLRNHDNIIDHDGKVMPSMVTGFRAAYWDMVGHGMPDGIGADLIDQLARFYLGDPPAPATDLDRMHGDEVYAELCNISGQPTIGVRPSRFAVCALPEAHPSYRYLVLHVDLRRVDPDQGARWSVRWGSFVYALDDSFENGDWEVAASCPDDVDRDHWLRQREFPLTAALLFARVQAVKVDVNGRTAADIIAHDQAARAAR